MLTFGKQTELDNNNNNNSDPSGHVGNFVMELGIYRMRKLCLSCVIIIREYDRLEKSLHSLSLIQLTDEFNNPVKDVASTLKEKAVPFDDQEKAHQCAVSF